jgi:hypothetical protein
MLRTYLRRRFGSGLQFISVLEFQKDGTPHLHLLVDRWISQPWIKAAWMALGGGEFVNIKFVDVHRVARYLSKYLTKELLCSAPKRSRRITTSRGIQLIDKPEPTCDWTVYTTRIRSLVGYLEMRFGVFPMADVVLDEAGELEYFALNL